MLPSVVGEVTVIRQPYLGVAASKLTSILASKGTPSQSSTTHACPMNHGSSEGGTGSRKQGQGPLTEAALLEPAAHSLGKPIPGNQQRVQITECYQIAQPSPHRKQNPGKPSDLILACFPGIKEPLTLTPEKLFPLRDKNICCAHPCNFLRYLWQGSDHCHQGASWLETEWGSLGRDPQSAACLPAWSPCCLGNEAAPRLTSTIQGPPWMRSVRR